MPVSHSGEVLDSLLPCKASLGCQLGILLGEPAQTLVSRLPSAFVGDSGGHFNPAVSLAATLIGGLNLVMLLPYWISQLCGGLIGAALAKVGASLGAGLVECGEGVGRGRCPALFPWDFPPAGLGGSFSPRKGPFGSLQTHPVLFVSGHSPSLDRPERRIWGMKFLFPRPFLALDWLWIMFLVYFLSFIHSPVHSFYKLRVTLLQKLLD